MISLELAGGHVYYSLLRLLTTPSDSFKVHLLSISKSDLHAASLLDRLCDHVVLHARLWHVLESRGRLVLRLLLVLLIGRGHLSRRTRLHRLLLIRLLVRLLL